MGCFFLRRTNSPACVHLLVVDSWAGYEHSSFCGQQFVLERGEYPHWDSWSGSNAYHIERMMSFRPICSAVSYRPSVIKIKHLLNHLGFSLEILCDALIEELT